MPCVISFVATATNQPLFVFLFVFEQPLHFVHFVLFVLQTLLQTEVVLPVNSITYLTISHL